jgi:CRP-like cAMP-binding protein
MLRSCTKSPVDGAADQSRLEDLVKAALVGARPESVVALASRAASVCADAGSVVLHQGDPGKVLLVVEGCTASRRTTGDGRRLILALSKVGSIVSPASTPWQGAGAEVVAVMPTRIASWSARDLRALAATDPALGLALVDLLGQQLADMAWRFDQLVDQTVRERLLVVLAEHGELFFGEPAVLPRTMLPELVATSREMTGRVVRDLERDGVIARVGRRGLRLLDPGPLEAARGLMRQAP